jgi:hypothetical protein
VRCHGVAAIASRGRIGLDGLGEELGGPAGRGQAAHDGGPVPPIAEKLGELTALRAAAER